MLSFNKTAVLSSWIVNEEVTVLTMGENFIKDFPFSVEYLDPKENEELSKDIRGYKEEFVRIGPKKYFIMKRYLSMAAAVYNLPLKPDDTFVITYPKSERAYIQGGPIVRMLGSDDDILGKLKELFKFWRHAYSDFGFCLGTTLTQELVWLLCNNLDFETAASTILNKRFPFLEVSTFVRLNVSGVQEDEVKNRLATNTIEEIIEMPSPRFVKSHAPLSLLPPSLFETAKVVYMVRDPRDVAVSYYHHHKLIKMMKPDQEFKPYWNHFISNDMFWAPYFEHVLEAWEKRNHPNMLFLVYEDVIKDLPGAVRRVADFFKKTLSDEEVSRLANHLSFENFKNNKSVNMENLQQSGVFTKEGAFVRKGKPGGWREYFDEEMTAQADEWIAKNLRDTDFRLPTL